MSFRIFTYFIIFDKMKIYFFSVVHTGNREFSCPHCSQRFGRKDHMTRHAKKTHQQFYDPEQLRLMTPTPTKLEIARSSRSERSVSDPGPAPRSRYSPEKLAPVTSPTHVVVDFQKLGTEDVSAPSSTISYLMDSEKNYIQEDRKPSSLYSATDILGQENIPGINTDGDQLFILPDKSNAQMSDNSIETINHSQLQGYDIKPSLRMIERKYTDMPPLIPIETEHLKKLETYSEDSNSAENAMKELLEEKDNIDFDSFINEIGVDIFQKKPARISSNTYAEIKDEPRSCPGSPDPATIMTFPQVDPLSGYCSNLEAKPVPKPIFIRTQSQDSLTRTKNPVLPSIHFEGSLVVPEPKQVRYSSQDPFTLEYDDESQQLTELKGSLFMTDEENQAYFQPWN